VAEGDTRHVERSRRGVAGADGSADHSGSDRIHADACVGQVECGAHRQMVLALGRSVAHRYAKEGHSVALVARRRERWDRLPRNSQNWEPPPTRSPPTSRGPTLSRDWCKRSVGRSANPTSSTTARRLEDPPHLPLCSAQTTSSLSSRLGFTPLSDLSASSYPDDRMGRRRSVGGDGSERDAGNAPLQRRRSCPSCRAKSSAVAGDRSRRQGVSTSADLMSARPSSTAFGTPGREAARGAGGAVGNQGPMVAPDHLADLMWGHAPGDETARSGLPRRPLRPMRGAAPALPTSHS
jgi:hypothetical protein